MIQFHRTNNTTEDEELNDTTYIGTIEDGTIVDRAETLPKGSYAETRALDYYIDKLTNRMFDPLTDPIAVIHECNKMIPTAAVPTQESADYKHEFFSDGDAWELPMMPKYGILTETERSELSKWDHDDVVSGQSPFTGNIVKHYEYPDRFSVVAIIYQANSHSKQEIAGSWDTKTQSIVADINGRMEYIIEDMETDAGRPLSNALGLVKQSRRPYICNVVDKETEGLIASGKVLRGAVPVEEPDTRYPELLPE